MPRRRSPLPGDALARVVLDRYLRVRRGESLTIETWNHGLPWARSFVVEARRRGARPALIVEDEGAFFRSLELMGSASASGSSRAPAGRGEPRVYIGGPEEFPRLLGLPPRDQEAVLARHDGVWWRAALRSRTRAVRLAVGDATATAAKRYEVDEGAWQAELLKASVIDPRRLEATGRRLLRGLARGRRLRIRHHNGTRLVVERGTRAPMIDFGVPDPASGAVWGRVPSGLLLVPLRRGSAEGVWETNRPVYDRLARPPVAVGGRFRFHRGRLDEFAFDRGGEPFAAAYARAGPGRERPVALTVGLNPAISHAPEVLELGAGTLGLLLGDAPYPGVGHRSRFSFLAPLAGANVEVDGRIWLVGGEAAPPARR